MVERIIEENTSATTDSITSSNDVAGGIRPVKAEEAVSISGSANETATTVNNCSQSSGGFWYILYAILSL